MNENVVGRIENLNPSEPPKPHVHTKMWLGLNISGPSQSGLEVNNLRLCFCPECKLAYIEVLPNTLPTMVGR